MVLKVRRQDGHVTNTTREDVMVKTIPRRSLLSAPKVKIATVGACLLLIGTSAGVYRERSLSGSGAVSYATATAASGTLAQSVTATGPIAAAQAVPLNFKNSGKLSEIDVKIGATVAAGQVLAKLDPADLQASLGQAQANLAGAQAAYNKLLTSAQPADIAVAQAAINAANTQLNSAKTALAATQVVATKDVASAQQALANAQQAYNDALSGQQTLPAVLQQSILQAKDKLYSDQIADDAAVGRGSMTKEQRQAALDVDQTAIDQANAAAVQQQAQQQASVDQAAAAVKSAQSALTSTQAKDAQSVTAAQAQLDSAQAGIQTAQASYQKTLAPATQADLAGAQASIAAQQSAVQLAQNNLDAAVLKAPSAGTVTAINGAVGQWLSGGATSGSAASSASGASTSSSSTDFVDLTQLSSLQVSAQVNEADIASVKVGDPVTFTVSALPNQTFTGKVVTIQPLGQNTSNVVAYTVTSAVDQANTKLLPGMTATESIITSQVQNAVSVPATAVAFARSQGSAAPASSQATTGARASTPNSTKPAATTSGKPASASGAFDQPNGPGTLYVLQGGQLQAVPVQLGISTGSSIQVVSGLNAGAQVVTSSSGGKAVASSAKAASPSGGTSILGGGPPAGGPRG